MFRQLRFILACSLLISVCAQPAQTHRRLETITIRVQEGTTLSFDISPDNRSIVFDLLGQLWLLPAQGGKARPLTDAVRETAEDLDPSFSPDSRRVIFRGERNGRTGLWLMDLDSRAPRQLTQLPDPEGYDGNAAWSPDGRLIAFVHFVPPASTGSRWRPAIMLLDVASGSVHELSITGIQNPRLRDPVWVRGGREIAFVESKGKLGGRVWIVDAKGGQATPVTDESVQAQAPAFSADGRRMAYFASDSAGRTQVWVQEITNGVNPAGPPIQITIIPTLHSRGFAGFRTRAHCCIPRTVVCGRSTRQAANQSKSTSRPNSHSLVQNERCRLHGFPNKVNSSSREVSWDSPFHRTDAQ
jgi:Tol biopolymer transport system component